MTTNRRWVSVACGVAMLVGAGVAWASSNNVTDFRRTGSCYGQPGEWSYMYNWTTGFTVPFAAGDTGYDAGNDAWHGGDTGYLYASGNTLAGRSTALAYTFQTTGTAVISGSAWRDWGCTRMFALLTHDNLSNGYDGSYFFEPYIDPSGRGDHNDNWGVAPTWSPSNYKVAVQAGDSLVMEWTWDARVWYGAYGGANLTVTENGVEKGFLGNNKSTNNIADFNGSTNVIDGGRWSYLSGDVASSVYTLGDHYNAGLDWCVDHNNPNYVWVLRSDGGVWTDGRQMIYNYTVNSGEAGPVRISGTFGGAGGAVSIYKTTDPALGEVVLSTATLLFSGTGAFDLTTTVTGGNDILFVCTNPLYWWERLDLNATIAAAPQATTIQGQVSLGGFVGDNSTVGITLQLRKGGSAVKTEKFFLNADGSFSVVTNIIRDTYDIAIDADSWLGVAEPGVDCNAAVNTLAPVTLKGGDGNGDNAVTFEDFSILQNSYGQTGAASANPLAAAAATGGCGSLGLLLLAGLGLALYTLGLRNE